VELTSLLSLAVGTAGWRKWMALGTGVGIEARPDSLRIAISRMRPGGAEALAEKTIEIGERTAASWGAEYAAFAKQHGAADVPVALLLPRGDVIVRQLALPGVAEKDMAAAVEFQIDGLHPFDEAEAVWCWARLGTTSSVLVGIARRETLDAWMAHFAEAGIKIASITFTAAALYTSLRLYSAPEAEGFVAVWPDGESLEVYGESPARPVFSTVFDNGWEMTRRMALSELRLDPETSPRTVERLVPPPVRAPEGFEITNTFLPYAASLVSAAPSLALDANLLPADRRISGSKLAYILTLLLLGMLGVAAVMLGTQESAENAKYLKLLNEQTLVLDKRARQVEKLDEQAAALRARVGLLDRFRQRSPADADVLREITTLLAPPAWAPTVTIGRDDIQVNAEADQAAPLIKSFDDSSLFRNSSFSQVQARQGGGEAFIIRAQREGPGTGDK